MPQIFVLVAFLYLSGTQASPQGGAAAFDTQAACEAQGQALEAKFRQLASYQDFQYQCFLIPAPPVRKST